MSIVKKMLADPRVEEYSNETENGDGHWFYLKPGFINSEREVHCIHEQLLKDCLPQLKWIRPCACDQCIDGFKLTELKEDDLIPIGAKYIAPITERYQYGFESNPSYATRIIGHRVLIPVIRKD